MNGESITPFNDQVSKALSTVNEVKSITQKLLARLDYAIDLIGQYSDSLEGISDEDLGAMLDSIEMDIRSKTIQILERIEEPLYPGRWDESAKEEKDTLLQYLIKEGIISINLIDEDTILYRIPMMPKRLKEQVRTSHFGTAFPKKGDSPFSSQLMDYSSKMDLYGRVYSDPKWRMKTLNIFFVYAQEEKQIIDNDNHEIKQLIDAIASSIPTGDTGIYTVIVLSSMRSDLIPKGTYVFVKPGLGSFIKIPEMKSYFLSNPAPKIQSEAGEKLKN